MHRRDTDGLPCTSPCKPNLPAVSDVLMSKPKTVNHMLHDDGNSHELHAWERVEGRWLGNTAVFLFSSAVSPNLPTSSAAFVSIVKTVDHMLHDDRSLVAALCEESCECLSPVLSSLQSRQLRFKALPDVPIGWHTFVERVSSVRGTVP
ncbi:hypothetical protein PG991_012109 [Apiospora marii]|uniref:Uncharacterized protein n=1 Tax=Apiospora marii TaxID=335849 RepID=A0ABR1R926_9PEZI